MKMRSVIQLLSPGQKGNAYIALQRYEYENKGAWENAVPDMTIWKRTKATKSKVDRDRTHLSFQEVHNVISAITDNMPLEEVIHTLWRFKPYWDKNASSSATTHLVSVLRSKLEYTYKVKVEFPPEYLAANLSDVSERLKMSSWDAMQFLEKKGFTLCGGDFAKIGMRLASDTLLEVNPGAFQSDEEVLASKSSNEITITTEKTKKDQKVEVTPPANPVPCTGGLHKTAGAPFW